MAGDALDGLLMDSLDETRAVGVRRFFEESAARRRLLDRLRAWARRDEAGWSVRGAAGAWVGRRCGRLSLRANNLVRPVVRGVGVLGRQTLHRRAWASFGTVILGVLVFLVSRQVLPHFGERRLTAVQTYTTGDGQRANIMLSDGSIVALNVASQLDVPVDYASGDHTLRLRGEALFTVSHHEGIPLTVIAGPTTARVLGTSFVVRELSHRFCGDGSGAGRAGSRTIGRAVCGAFGAGKPYRCGARVLCGSSRIQLCEWCVNAEGRSIGGGHSSLRSLVWRGYSAR